MARPMLKRMAVNFIARLLIVNTSLRPVFLVAALFLSACANDSIHTMRVSIADQRMILLEKGIPVATYPVSTSKFGVGDRPGSYATPLGTLAVASKIGAGAPVGMKFKDRRATGEVVAIDAPGRDPIVTRILRLKGLQRSNAKAFERGIYIHGTPEERKIGSPASYGCIRMRSKDVIALFGRVNVGARLEIIAGPFSVPLAPVVVAPPDRSAPVAPPATAAR